MLSIAKALGATKVVFGSPHNRKPVDDNDDTFISAFRSIGDAARAFGIVVLIENNSSGYGCSYLTTLKSVLSMVSRIDHPYVRAILDIGNMMMENEVLPTSWSEVEHIHISSPFMNGVPLDFDKNSLPTDRVLSLESKPCQPLPFLMREFINIFSEDDSTLIVGAGWYGCHLYSIFQGRPGRLDVCDVSDSPFSGSSLRNQNRLHLGFHYPRSFHTRQECREGYARFMEKYPSLSWGFEKNYYLIAKSSVIDFNTYCTIFEHEGPQFDKVSFDDLNVPFLLVPSMFQGAIRTQERVIDAAKSKYFFESVITLRPFKDVNFSSYRTIYDCTYGQSAISMCILNETYQEDCISLVYEGPFPPVGITVMDGPFFSIYPYRIISTGCVEYTLTDVEYTPQGLSPHCARRRIEDKVRKYIPDFDEHFKFISHLYSTKTKFNGDAAADRSVKIASKDNVTAIIGGKITGIFELDRRLPSSSSM